MLALGANLHVRLSYFQVHLVDLLLRVYVANYVAHDAVLGLPVDGRGRLLLVLAVLDEAQQGRRHYHDLGQLNPLHCCLLLFLFLFWGWWDTPFFALIHFLQVITIYNI